MVNLWLMMVDNDIYIYIRLVGGFYQPLWKIWIRQLGWWHSQYFWKNEECSKPPTRSLHQIESILTSEIQISKDHQIFFDIQKYIISDIPHFFSCFPSNLWPLKSPQPALKHWRVPRVPRVPPLWCREARKLFVRWAQAILEVWSRTVKDTIWLVVDLLIWLVYG